MNREDELRQNYRLGTELFRKGDYREAYDLLAEFIQEMPGYADVHNMLGIIHSSRGQTTEAIEAFRAALDINPRYAEALLNLMALYDSLGEMKRTERLWARYHAAMRDMPAAETSHKGLDDLTRAKLANLHAEVAWVYQEKGYFTEAIDEYRKALGLRPEFVDIRARMATALRDRGDHKEAAEMYLQVLVDNPNLVSVHLHLGINYYLMDRIQEAVAHWKKVLKIDPDNRSAPVYLQFAERKITGDGGSA